VSEQVWIPVKRERIELNDPQPRELRNLLRIAVSIARGRRIRYEPMLAIHGSGVWRVTERKETKAEAARRLEAVREDARLTDEARTETLAQVRSVGYGGRLYARQPVSGL
jgi:hypothetical protein